MLLPPMQIKVNEKETERASTFPTESGVKDKLKSVGQGLAPAANADEN